jgi:hypothetical protein
MSQVSEIIVNWTPELSGRVATIQIRSRIVGTTAWTEQAGSLDASLGEFRFGSNAPATDVEVQARFRMVSGVFSPWTSDHIVTAPVTVAYVDLTGTPSKLEDINSSEGGKLTGIAPGATVGAPNGSLVGGIPAETVAGAITNLSGGGFLDNAAPPIPTGLALSTAITDNGASLSLTWTASTAPDIARYILAIKEASGSFIEYQTSAPAYLLNALPRNRSYTAKVKAADKAGNVSGFSAEVSTTTARDTVAPALPTGLSVATTYNGATLAWTNAADTDLNTVEVWRSTTNTSASAVKIDSVNAVSGQPGRYIASGLTQATTYYFFLKSVDTSLNASAFTVEEARS